MANPTPSRCAPCSSDNCDCIPTLATKQHVALDLLCGAIPGAWVGARIAHGLRPGVIALLHESPSLLPAVPVAALAAVLELLRCRGCQAVIPSADALL